MKRILLLLLALFLAGCSSASTSPRSQGKVLARFDGTTLTDLDFLKKVQSLPQALQKAAMQRKKELIDDMAAEHFLIKEAERQGLAKDPDVRDLIQTAQKKIVIAKLIENEIDKKLTLKPEDVTQYYEFHKEEFMTPLLFRASHILVKTEEEVNAVKAQLDAGGNFEELARRKSIDATAVRGGDLGTFQKGQFVPEFEEAVLAMHKGEVRGPVKTQFGYHLIQLTDRSEPRLRDFQSVRNLVEQKLIGERRSKAFKEYIEKLKGNIKIDIDEQALQRLGLPAK